MKSRILSGIRPTGSIQLGNYYGAIKNWLSLADQVKECFFCVVDQHALTTIEDAKDLSENTLKMTAAYLACGIDPDKTPIFIQSHIPYHTELAWYLQCFTPMGWLSRMTQFKDKAGKNKDQAMTGLFTYPTLMAADILLYQATQVPVGEDQKQHVEHTRDIAQSFNVKVGKNIFTLPEPLIPKTAARIMSLRDGTKKMSKSDPSEYSRINLTDSADDIALKIRKAKTDPELLPDKLELLERRPEAKNLLSIYAIASNKDLEMVILDLAGKSFADLKKLLTDALIAEIVPIGDKIHDYLKNQDHLKNILQAGALQADKVAFSTITEVRKSLNILS